MAALVVSHQFCIVIDVGFAYGYFVCMNTKNNTLLLREALLYNLVELDSKRVFSIFGRISLCKKVNNTVRNIYSIQIIDKKAIAAYTLIKPLKQKLCSK